MKHEGFLYDTGRRQVFFVTERKRKDKGTLNLIIEKHWGYAPTESMRRELDWYLSKATLEEEHTSTGVAYYKVTCGTGRTYYRMTCGKGSCMTIPKDDEFFEIVVLPQ